MTENTKIEKKAIHTLEGVVNECDFLNGQFNSMDKELSWDGYIYVYNDMTFSNKSLDDKIPVQIKGKLDDKQKDINKNKIQFPVNLDVLENYYNDRGVLFFCVILAPKKSEIFYSILYPARIKTYLDEAGRKKNKRQINITLSKMKNNSSEMLRICKQFTYESHKQGSGRGQLVPKAVNVRQLKEYKNIHAKAFGVRNIYEFAQCVSAGDVCFYANNEKSDIWYPLELVKGTEMYFGKDIAQEVRIGDKVYYRKFAIVVGTDNEQSIKFSRNLKFYWTREKFIFEKNTSINELANDAEFILQLLTNAELFIDQRKLSYSNIKLHDGLKEDLEFILDIAEICEKTNIVIDKEFNKLTQEEVTSIEKLVDFYRGKYILRDEQLYTYDLKVDEKIYPFIICKTKKDVVITNRIYESKYQGCVKIGNQHYRVPLFAELSGEYIGRLYKYDYAELYHQVDMSEFNDSTVEVFNNTILALIIAYDINNDVDLLNLAQYIIKKILEINETLIYVKINNYQIKKRKDELNDNDRHEIERIMEETKELSTKCASAALLDRKDEARKSFESMEIDVRKVFSQYPIFKYVE